MSKAARLFLIILSTWVLSGVMFDYFHVCECPKQEQTP